MFPVIVGLARRASGRRRGSGGRRRLAQRRPVDQGSRALHGHDARQLLQRAFRVPAGRADPGRVRLGVEPLATRDALPRLVDDLRVVGHAGRVTAAQLSTVFCRYRLCDQRARIAARRDLTRGHGRADAVAGSKSQGPTSAAATQAESQAIATGAAAVFSPVDQLLQVDLSQTGTYVGAELPVGSGVTLAQATATSYCLAGGLERHRSSTRTAPAARPPSVTAEPLIVRRAAQLLRATAALLLVEPSFLGRRCRLRRPTLALHLRRLAQLLDHPVGGELAVPHLRAFVLRRGAHHRPELCERRASSPQPREPVTPRRRTAPPPASSSSAHADRPARWSGRTGRRSRTRIDSASMAAILLDVDGVLHVSGAPIAGAAAAVRRLRADGHRIRFVSNTTTRSRAQIGDQLRQMGIEVEDDELQTTGAVAARVLNGKRVLALTMPGCSTTSRACSSSA